MAQRTIIQRIKLWLLMVVILIQACQPEVPEEVAQRSAALLAGGTLETRQKLIAGARIHYVMRVDRQPPEILLIFIHDTPGDWREFSSLLEDETLSSRATLVAVDRPGWGGSFFDEERVEPSLAEQARVLAPLLNDLHNAFPQADLVVAGHGWGASLAPVLAIENPTLVDGVVSIAGNLESDLVRYHWYNRVLAWTPVKMFLPQAVCFSNDEFVALADNLESLGAHWSQLRQPMLVILGEQDSQVDIANAAFARELNTGRPVQVEMIAGAGHALQLTHPGVVRDRLLQWLAQLPATEAGSGS